MTLLFVLGSLLAAAGAESSGIARAAWLQGCWEAASANRTVEEQWMAPRGGSMLAVSRTVRGGALVEYELVVLREHEGGLVYHAHPSGQASAQFPSRSMADDEIVFENLEHDFPQRIGYRREGPDAMVAWIEGPRQGQTRRVEFPYKRVKCE